MIDHYRRSRVTKALTDSDRAQSFVEAEARLDAVSPAIAVGRDVSLTPAGQWAALTALATSIKCFGRATLMIDEGPIALVSRLPLGMTLQDAALSLGADVASKMPARATHLLRLGDGVIFDGWQAALWWDRWLAGVRREATPLGDGQLGLAGIFAGALGVRQIFADVCTPARAADATTSLWTPGAVLDFTERGPDALVVPNHLWLVGLGHLGQAFTWALLSLPGVTQGCAVLQDDQSVGIENEATSLLVSAQDVGRRKVRVASDWLEFAGWRTELIERRHRGDIIVTPDDPPILLAGLDDVTPRRKLAQLGFPFMIDAGIGSGSSDFEGLQLRVIPRGCYNDALWLPSAPEDRRGRLANKGAYRELEREVGTCGTVPFQDASVAVPFVGAATAALAIAQAIRLHMMEPGCAMLQMELGAPEFVIDGGRRDRSTSFLGGSCVNL